MQGSTRGQTRPQFGGRRELQQERFGGYFPRVFAYACSVTGDEEAARDVVVASFTDVYSMPDLRNDEFELALFQAARELAQSPEFRLKKSEDGLTARERDVVALVFDAQVTRSQVAALIDVNEETVTALLLRGLRKLRTKIAPSGYGTAAPSFS